MIVIQRSFPRGLHWLLVNWTVFAVKERQCAIAILKTGVHYFATCTVNTKPLLELAIQQLYKRIHFDMIKHSYIHCIVLATSVTRYLVLMSNFAACYSQLNIPTQSCCENNPWYMIIVLRSHGKLVLNVDMRTRQTYIMLGDIIYRPAIYMWYYNRQVRTMWCVRD